MKLTQLQNTVSKFKQFVASMLSGSDCIPPNSDLQKRLSDNGLTYYPVARDGNCFFTALALNLASDMERWADRLAQAGFSPEIATDTDRLSKSLRQLFVQEILGERRLMYDNFMVMVKLNLSWKHRSSCRMGIMPAMWVISCHWQWQTFSMPTL